jgi:4-aminobutyrate aminotransferase/(S)-3-amino-2-methylpropionate transaminase
MKLIERDALLVRATQIGERIRERLGPLLTADYPGVKLGEIRGMGAMIALEFVTDRTTREPAPAQAVLDMVAKALGRGLLIMRAGLYANCIRLLTPLIITDEQLDEGLEILADIIQG